MTDEHPDLIRWLERHDLEFEGRDRILLDHDDRLDELEKQRAVQEAAVSILRWLLALGIPFVLIVFEMVVR